MPAESSSQLHFLHFYKRFNIKVCKHHPSVFVNSCLYTQSLRAQISERDTLSYYLLYVSAVFDHHQVVLTITSMEKNMGGWKLADGDQKQPKNAID
jgi:hypothetical protein